MREVAGCGGKIEQGRDNRDKERKDPDKNGGEGSHHVFEFILQKQQEGELCDIRKVLLNHDALLKVQENKISHKNEQQKNIQVPSYTVILRKLRLKNRLD